jgi:hypothetical protein
VSAFRPFRRADYGFTPAKIAKVAKVRPPEPSSLATLATLAGWEGGKRCLSGPYLSKFSNFSRTRVRKRDIRGPNFGKGRVLTGARLAARPRHMHTC